MRFRKLLLFIDNFELIRNENFDSISSYSPRNDGCARRKLHNPLTNLKIVIETDNIRFIIEKNAGSIH